MVRLLVFIRKTLIILWLWRLEGPDFKATDDKVFLKVGQGPILEGGALLDPAFVKIAVDENAEAALVGADDDVVAGPAVKVLVEATPFINA